ncbi:MAG: HEAT repeat domain-containing protein [Anaerolineales bacterium]
MFGPFGAFGMRWDWPEFFIGLATGLIITWMIVRSKPLSKWATGLVRSGMAWFNEAMTSGAQDRYRVELAQRAETLHSASALLALHEIAIPPRVLAPTTPTDPNQADKSGGDTLAVIPNLPDANYLSGVYAAPSMPLTDALRQGHDLMLTGRLGSGKSTSLAFLAIQAIRGVLRAENEPRRLPILLHIADLPPDRLNNKDPIDALVAGCQAWASAGLASRLSGYLQRHLSDRTALILIDGFDEFPALKLPPYVHWLANLRRSYPGNQVVVAGPPQGYDGLAHIGLAPVSIAPWTDYLQRQFMRRWGAAWAEHVAPHLNRSSLEEIDPVLISGWLSSISRGLSPMELTLRVWAAHAGDALGDGVAESYEAFLRRFLSAEEQQSAAAAGVAWIESRDGTFEEAAVQRGTPVGDLVEAGILTRRPEHRLSFRTPSLGTYLAGQGMVDLGVPEAADQHNWLASEAAMGFYIALGDGSAEVEHSLASGQDDLLRRPVLRVGHWLRLAPKKAGWRPQALRELAKIIQNSSLAYGLRLRATHAMAESHESTAIVFFRRLLSADQPSSRILGALGLGGLRDTDAIGDLKRVITSDPDGRVRNAACLALAGLGSDDALEVLGETLINGEEGIRVAAAESLAIQPDEGYDMLKEAVGYDDLLTRRAAVFGLARVPERWARDVLETLQLEDQQWVVRGAAADAFEKWDKPAYSIPTPPDEISELPWLVAFAGREGLGIAPGKAALEMVRRALNSGTIEEKIAALETIAWVEGGDLNMELQNALSGDDVYLRDAAFESLWRQQAGGGPVPEGTASEG